MDRQSKRENINPEESEIRAKFDEAFEMVLNDEPAEPVDAVFLHALSYDDDDEMFPLAASYIKEGKAKYIVVNGSDGRRFEGQTPGEAWAGKDEYIRRLKELGVNEDQIVVSAPALHTRQANDAYLDTAKAKGWKTAVTLNQPQQLLRAELGQIQAMKKKDYWMRVYTSFPLPWDEEKEVYGQQGKEKEPRYKLLGKEYERILDYQGKGDLASFDEFFDYMDKRAEIR
jgi:hypothetical protein